MKIAITGKGGVGKSTISAILSKILLDASKKVILIDADPDMNLAALLGIPENREIKPISEYKELIAERTDTEPGKPAPFFRLNPKVDDIPEKYCMDHNGIKFLIMGSIKGGGAGCACPENAFLKSLISHLLIGREEWVILDMEAGIEHLGRATAYGVDIMLIVVEPSINSIHTAFRIEKLAKEIGIKNISIVANKVKNEKEKDFIKSNLGNLNLTGFISNSPNIDQLNTGEKTSFDFEDTMIDELKTLIRKEKWI